MDCSEATADEVMELVFRRGGDRGRVVTLTELVGMETAEFLSGPCGRAELALRRAISARCAVRAELDLPRHSCAYEQSVCSCQSEAIDALLELERLEGVTVDSRAALSRSVRDRHLDLGRPRVVSERPVPESPPARPVRELEPDAGDPEPVPEPEPVRVVQRPVFDPGVPRDFEWRSQRSRDESPWSYFVNTRW